MGVGDAVLGGRARVGPGLGFGVYIRYLGNGWYGFRPYGGSLWKSRNAGPAQSNQRALAPTLGTSLTLGVPQIHIEFRPACLTGRLRSRSQTRSRADQERVDICLMNGDSNCGSWLACDAGNSVHEVNQGDAIAGKPAPTFEPSTAHTDRSALRPPRFASAFDLRRPVKHAGRTQALERG